MTTALLIIDVQQALCSGEYEAFEAQRVIERINLVSSLENIPSHPSQSIGSDQLPFVSRTAELGRLSNAINRPDL